MCNGEVLIFVPTRIVRPLRLLSAVDKREPMSEQIWQWRPCWQWPLLCSMLLLMAPCAAGAKRPTCLATSFPALRISRRDTCSQPNELLVPGQNPGSAHHPTNAVCFVNTRMQLPAVWNSPPSRATCVRSTQMTGYGLRCVPGSRLLCTFAKSKGTPEDANDDNSMAQSDDVLDEDILAADREDAWDDEELAPDETAD